MDKDKIWVVTSDTMMTRGSGSKQLRTEELAVNVNLFIGQIGSILEKTPNQVGQFHFDEFEVHAEITAQGAIAILGTGMQAGGSGGLRFVFRCSSASNDKT